MRKLTPAERRAIAERYPPNMHHSQRAEYDRARLRQAEEHNAQLQRYFEANE